METKPPQEQDSAANRKVITIDGDFHQRIKVLAAIAAVQLKDVIHTILDYTIPKLESGELTIQKPSIQSGDEEGGES